MPTTIQVQEKTLRFLKLQKKRLKAETYDEVIRYLAERKQTSREAMFGIDQGRIHPFSEEDHLKFHEDL